MSKRAILSVYDKTGLIELGQGLVGLGWELIASGGTARALREAKLTVRDVADVTGAPEMLDGRVKTLHPAIHGGILARATSEDAAELAARGIAPIDLVVVNLYPFAATVARPEVTTAEAVEQIDIGGVALLRAAAKNFARVVVLCDPGDYSATLAALAAGGPDEPRRRQLAARAFARCSEYDAAIAGFLVDEGPESDGQVSAASGSPLPDKLTVTLRQVTALRYGENPHQAAALYGLSAATGPLGGRLLAGKELSYNNLLDLDAAWRAAESFAAPAVVIVKHLSPCGLAVGRGVAEAFGPALASDPLSAFGGVIAANRPIDAAFVAALAAAELFVEAVAAPGFDEAALAWFAAHKKSCRLLALGALQDSIGSDLHHQTEIGKKGQPTQESGSHWGSGSHWLELRAVRGGVLAQTRDAGDPLGTTWRVAGRRAPSAAEMVALRFAWLAGQHVKSNAIVLAGLPDASETTATVGIGGGLPSRVDAVRLAVAKAGQRARGAVLASDAFFPFADGLEAAAAAGVTAVVEPGGSVRDDEVIAAADRLDVALVFTGVRHFRH